VSKQNCAFVNFATRNAAETAAEKSANKLTIHGQRLKVLWGKSMSTFEKSVAAQQSQPQDYVEGVVIYTVESKHILPQPHSYVHVCYYLCSNTTSSWCRQHRPPILSFTRSTENGNHCIQTIVIL